MSEGAEIELENGVAAPADPTPLAPVDLTGAPLAPAPVAAPSGEAAILRSPFARKVAGVFGTRVALFGLAFSTSILISWLLDPKLYGPLVAITTLPGMLSAIGMFGLPSATNYFAGKGNSLASLMRAAFVFTALLSIVLIGIVWFALPWLESSFLGAAKGHDDMLRVIIFTLPLGMLAAFGGTILYGRQSVRSYNLIQLAQASMSFALTILLVGVLGLGIWGGVWSSVIISALLAAAVLFAVWRLAQRDRSGSPASIRSLLSYGARVYPASLTSFFNYRADSYLIQALIIGSAGPYGLYARAVTMAEIVFYVPDSIGTIFLPRVAGSTAEDANQMVRRVSRLSVLLTVLVALALIPTAFVGIHVVLTKYVDCLPAFFVLLPGVVSLSVAKVMSSFVSGRGRPGLISVVTSVALVLNVGLNLIFIPRFGIVGASLASLISYTAHAAMTLFIASRLSGHSMLTLIVPGRAEVALLVAGLRRLAGRIRSRNVAPSAGAVR
jgi:O-antigen/teichoic acid export membrane protein